MLASPGMTREAHPAGTSGFGGARCRVWILTSSVVAHGALLATLTGFQLWQVEAVAEPPVADVFEVQLPRPPVPAAPAAEQDRGRAESQPRHAPTQPPPLPPTRPPVVQPNPAAIPDRVPAPSSDPPPADPQTVASDADRSGRDVPATGSGDGDGRGKAGRSGSGSANDDPLPVGGAISRPQIVPGTKVQPRYTETARVAHEQGVVVLQAVIDERGNVIDARIVKNLGFGLGQEAVKAVQPWKFTPALMAGQPVKVYFNLTVQFELR